MQERRGQGPAGLELSDAAMAQLYRGELGRSDRWRTRLDTTTNWALTTSAAVISFGFGSRESTHVTLLAGLWLVMTFLVIEARRYRYYDLWNRRVRLIEDGYWAPLLRREPVDPDALRELATEMDRPQLQLTFAAAVQTRLNRAYGSLLVVLMLSWFAKVHTHPAPAVSLQEFIARAHLGPISGWVVSGLMVVLMLSFALLWLVSFFARSPLGELRARPRPRRSLWDAFYRPYLAAAPRRRRGATGV
ncbi:MAG: DUF2270 domain-containing protein [Myxococcales bacterium]|nr:DUF2270 domain-containing protein [Myxococcales bacterium]